MITTTHPSGEFERCHEVLFISSDRQLERALRGELAGVDDIAIEGVNDPAAAADFLETRPYDVVLVDVTRTSNADLSELVHRLRHMQPGAAVIVVLDERDPDLAEATVMNGAQDVLVRGEFTSGRLAKSLRLACIRARSLQTLENAVVALERRNSDLDEFACAVGHDLRSPIRTARALAELADRRLDSSPAELSDLLRRIESALDRLDMRVSALLRLARVGRTSVDRRMCTLDALVDRVTTDMAADLGSVGADVAVRSDGAGLAVDPELFSELLQNLIANAVAYHRPGVAPEIEIAAVSTRAAAVVTVTDNGPGIPVAARERAMQMFERLSAIGDGTGVGLALCRRIAEAHDGNLWLDDREDGPGLQVRIWIPHLRSAIDVTGEHTEQPATGATPSGPDLSLAV